MRQSLSLDAQVTSGLGEWVPTLRARIAQKLGLGVLLGYRKIHRVMGGPVSPR